MPALTMSNLAAYVLQVGAIVAVGGALPFILRLSAPRARLAYWRALFVLCLALPLVQPFVPTARARFAPPVVRSAEVTSVTVVGNGASAAAQPPIRGTWPVSVIVGGVLMIGTLARFGWLGLGLITLGRMRRTAPLLLPRPEPVQQAADLVGADAEFRSAPSVARPVTFGAVLPVVLVPARFVSFAASEQKAIACHELLHVRRHDWIRTTFDEMVRAVAWFHPAVWWLMDQIQLAREEVVDREVVQLVGERQPYLQALLRLAALPSRPALRPASLFLRRAHLSRRVALLVKEVSMSRPRLLASFAAMAVVLFVAGRVVVNAFPLQMVQSAGSAPATVLAAQQQTPPAANQQPAERPLMGQVTITGMIGPAQGGSVQGGVSGGVVGGVVGGTSAGLRGGIVGGVAGGVAGGVEGGVIGGVQSAAPIVNVLSRVDPIYPANRPSPMTGIVIVKVSVEASGMVSDARMLSGESATPVAEAKWSGSIDASSFGPVGAQAITDAALAAARQWLFQPAQAPFTAVIGFHFIGPEIVGGPAPQAFRIGGNMPPPTKIADVKPQYPADAQAKSLSGVQILEATVDSSGQVLDAIGLRGDESLMVAAMHAVLKWRYQPPLLNGNPIRSLMTVTVNFTLSGVAPASAPLPAGTVTPPPPIPAAWPQNAIRVGGNIPAPRKIIDVRPVYPEDAIANKVEGMVICEAVIGPDGKVNDVKVLRSVPMLEQAAIDAVKQWQYTPTLLNGNPVPVIMTVTVNFTLN
jgi:protein TonB